MYVCMYVCIMYVCVCTHASLRFQAPGLGTDRSCRLAECKSHERWGFRVCLGYSGRLLASQTAQVKTAPDFNRALHLLQLQRRPTSSQSGKPSDASKKPRKMSRANTTVARAQPVCSYRILWLQHGPRMLFSPVVAMAPRSGP